MQLKILNIDEVFEGERRRVDYGDISELALSIKEKGLINPIAVGLTKNYIESDKEYILIAGGRRFRACQQIGMKDIPVRIYDRQLNDLELRSIELEENVRRKSLSWEEKIFLEDEINQLQISIHGEKISKAPGASGHSIRDTAKLLGKSHSTVVQDLKLVKAIKDFPEMPWKKCKNKNDANKLLKKVTAIVERSVLSTDAKAAISTNGGQQKHMSEAYIINDVFEALPKLQSGMFDLVEIDPPYGIDLEHTKQNYSYEDYNEVEKKDYKVFLEKLMSEVYRVMAPSSWLVFWFAPEPWFEDVYQAIKKTGLVITRMCGIWNKSYGQTNSPTTRLGNSYEMFFYARKGQATLAKPGSINGFEFSPVSPDNKKHPTERPVPLMQEILTTFAKPNAKVLVPFAGSGATLIAAGLEDMIPIGYDLSESYQQDYLIKVKNQF